MRLKIKTAAIMTGALLGAAATVTSCAHKDLCYDHTHLIPVDVVFDWTNAPEADPESMAAYFYDGNGGNPQRYIFTDKNGGRVKIAYGDYMGIGTNSDNTDWASTRNETDIETFETYTGEVTVLSGNGFETRSLPKTRADNDEKYISLPKMMWSARTDGIHLAITDTLRQIVFRPSEAICHYTVIITGVKNLEYLHGSALDATLTGMSEGYLHGSQQPTDTHATVSFTLPTAGATDELRSTFLTFGESKVTANPHYLTVYMKLTDGTKWYSTFDVAQQIRTAPDPHNVVIRIDGLTLPKPILHDSGFHPEVNDWQVIEVDLKM